MKTELPSPNWTPCGQNAAWTARAFHYGESTPNTTDADIYVIDAREMDAPWSVVISYPEAEARGEEPKEPEVVCLMRSLPKAMEYAQRLYWGRVYYDIVGYDAHEDDKTRTSLDMIRALAEVAALLNNDLPAPC